MYYPGSNPGTCIVLYLRKIMKPFDYYDSLPDQSQFFRDLFKHLGWDRFTTKQQTALWNYVYEHTDHTYSEMYSFAMDLNNLVDIITH